MKTIDLYPENQLRGRPLMLRLLKDFYQHTGRTTFTYTDLRRWYYGTDAYARYGRDWHTIERLLRKYASDDDFPYLERAELDKRHVLFEVRLPEMIPVLRMEGRM